MVLSWTFEIVVLELPLFLLLPTFQSWMWQFSFGQYYLMLKNNLIYLHTKRDLGFGICNQKIESILLVTKHGRKTKHHIH